MLTREFEYVVNQSSKIKVFIRASCATDNAILAAAVSKLFQFVFCTIKVLKIHELNLKTISKDRLLSSPVRSFATSYDQLLPSRMAMHGYPSGYSSQGDNIEKFHPSMSSTTMSLLGIHEGEQKGLLNVIIKYCFGPKLIAHAMHVIPEGFRYKHAIDQDGSLYMKFQDSAQAGGLAGTHFFIDNRMIKFYNVVQVTKLSDYADKANKTISCKERHGEWFEPM
jgi:hypothetical protein